MKSTFKVLSNFEYKKNYLPFLDPQILGNTNSLQVYSIQQYLKGIVIPVQAYRTSFNFIIFVAEGHIEQQINKDTYTVTCGACVHVREGVWTATQVISDNAEGFVVVYESDILTQYLLLQGKQGEFRYTPFYNLELYDHQAVIASLLLLEEELKHPQNRVTIYMPLFYSILSRLNYYVVDTIWSVRDIEIAYRFKQLVQQHHVDNRCVTHYAGLMCISENYLNRCMKRVTGHSAKQWINQISIQHSKLLLRDLTKDIAEVAYELNYPSPSYFSKIFKRSTGQSPNTYRHLLSN
jgi:AraC-like DNA-binding protein/co-chaperonin GroES (HSP10)